jgi:molybdopterin-guanine dinucleotide biosynthesis protein
VRSDSRQILTEAGRNLFTGVAGDRVVAVQEEAKISTFTRSTARRDSTLTSVIVVGGFREENWHGVESVEVTKTEVRAGSSTFNICCFSPSD